MNEEWQPVPGVLGHSYQVSSEGRVRSLPRTVLDSRWGCSNRPGKILKGVPHSVKGYLRVVLYHQGVRTTFDIHQIVALTFIGPKPKGREVCHNSGDVTDNSVSNLRYDTRSGNMKDRVKHGTHGGKKVTRVPDGRLFSSLLEASKVGGLSRRTIKRHCENKVSNPEWKFQT